MRFAATGVGRGLRQQELRLRLRARQVGTRRPARQDGGAAGRRAAADGLRAGTLLCRRTDRLSVAETGARRRGDGVGRSAGADRGARFAGARGRRPANRRLPPAETLHRRAHVPRIRADRVRHAGQIQRLAPHSGGKGLRAWNDLPDSARHLYEPYQRRLPLQGRLSARIRKGRGEIRLLCRRVPYARRSACGAGADEEEGIPSS